MWGQCPQCDTYHHLLSFCPIGEAEQAELEAERERVWALMPEYPDLCGICGDDHDGACVAFRADEFKSAGIEAALRELDGAA